MRIPAAEQPSALPDLTLLLPLLFGRCSVLSPLTPQQPTRSQPPAQPSPALTLLLLLPLQK